MKVLSLFSGIGGFDLAAQRQGHEIIGACEIDEYARQIYAERFPKIRIYEDATKIRPEKLPDFDLLCAGFPCQTFSTAGKRLGFKESRGTLFYEIARIAKEKRPRYLLLENVPGLLNHDKGKTFAEILYTLDELGYDAEWQIIDSEDYVPQSRKRLFIIGHNRDTSYRQIFPLGQLRELSSKQEKSASVRTFTFGDKTCGIHSQMTMIMLSNTKANIKQRKQARDKTWTLDTSNSYFAILQDNKFRKLTPLECERLQGFPDNWTRGISDTQRYKCIGNAVTVPVVEYIIRQLTVRGKR